MTKHLRDDTGTISAASMSSHAELGKSTETLSSLRAMTGSAFSLGLAFAALPQAQASNSTLTPNVLNKLSSLRAVTAGRLNLGHTFATSSQAQTSNSAITYHVLTDGDDVGDYSVDCTTATTDSNGVTSRNCTTLRSAINASNATAYSNSPNANYIDVSTLSGTIALTFGKLAVTNSMTIVGPTDQTTGLPSLDLTIDGSGNGNAGVFYVNGASPVELDLEGVVISHGSAPCGGAIATSPSGTAEVFLIFSNLTNNSATSAGGAICSLGAGDQIILGLSIVSGNTAPKGGGIYARYGGNIAPNNSYDYGSFSLASLLSSVSGNQATGTLAGARGGGGIYLKSPNLPAVLFASRIANNGSAAAGGGIYLYTTASSGEVVIVGSTISGNSAATDGGGLEFVQPATYILLANSTISGNSAGGNGGGIDFKSTNNNTLISFSTIADNTAGSGGGGIELDDGILPIQNSIVAGNTVNTIPLDLVRSDITAGFALSYSLVQNPGSVQIPPNVGIITDLDPQLGPLQDNGSSGGALGYLNEVDQFSLLIPLSRAPAKTSPVIDHADPAAVLPSIVGSINLDERGFPRVVNSRTDMGAVEFNNVFQFNVAAVPVNETDGHVTLTVDRPDGSVDAISVSYATINGTAIGGVNYTATSGTLAWPANDTNTGRQQTITIPILNQNLSSGSKTFTVVLSIPNGNPSFNALVGTQNVATVTIDHAPVSVPGLTGAGRTLLAGVLSLFAWASLRRRQPKR